MGIVVYTIRSRFSLSEILTDKNLFDIQNNFSKIEVHIF